MLDAPQDIACAPLRQGCPFCKVVPPHAAKQPGGVLIRLRDLNVTGSRQRILAAAPRSFEVLARVRIPGAVRGRILHHWRKVTRCIIRNVQRSITATVGGQMLHHRRKVTRGIIGTSNAAPPTSCVTLRQRRASLRQIGHFWISSPLRRKGLRKTARQDKCPGAPQRSNVCLESNDGAQGEHITRATTAKHIDLIDALSVHHNREA